MKRISKRVLKRKKYFNNDISTNCGTPVSFCENKRKKLVFLIILNGFFIICLLYATFEYHRTNRQRILVSNASKKSAAEEKSHESQVISDMQNAWFTYEDTGFQFYLTYPTTQVFLYKTDAGNQLPYMIVDTQFIPEPMQRDGNYSPVEIRVGSQLSVKTIAEEVQIYKKFLKTGSYTELPLPPKLSGKGIWVKGLCDGDPCDGREVQRVVLKGSRGLMAIDYYPYAFDGRFSQELFSKLIANFELI
jgi:hypothetical protein